MKEKEIIEKLNKVDELLAKQDPRKGLEVVYDVRKKLRKGQEWYLGRTYFWEQLCWKYILDVEKSVKAGDKAIKIFAKLGDSVEISKILRDRGQLFERIGSYKDANSYLQQSLHLLKNTQEVLSFGISLSKLGETYLSLGDINKAEKYSSLGMFVLEEGDNLFFYLTSLLVHSSVMIGKEDYLSALQSVKTAEAVIKKLNKEKGHENIKRKADILLRKSIIHLKIRDKKRFQTLFKMLCSNVLRDDQNREIIMKDKLFLYLLEEYKALDNNKYKEICKKYSLKMI